MGSFDYHYKITELINDINDVQAFMPNTELKGRFKFEEKPHADGAILSINFFELKTGRKHLVVETKYNECCSNLVYSEFYHKILMFLLFAKDMDSPIVSKRFGTLLLKGID
jgi:hypothetical protein